MRPPRHEILDAFRERCPAVVVAVRPEQADYIVTLGHSEWHSPPYKTAVFTRGGDVI